MIEEEIRTQFKIAKVTKSLRTLYAIVWMEIAVLAFTIVMMAWLLLYAVDEIKETLNDNSQLVEIALGGTSYEPNR